MSLSKPRENSSPVKRFVKVKGATGGLTYWDGEAREEKPISLPFSFVVLDSLSAISGFHKPSNSGIFSNEVRDTRDEVLRVRSQDGVLAEGLYDEIKDKVKGKGGKFATSLYFAFKDGDELAIGNILLAGAALSGFFDFKKGRNLDREPGVSIVGFDGPFTHGTTTYYVPKFDSWTPRDLSAAEDLDRTLQDYLSGASAPKAEAQESPWSNATPSQTSFGEPLEEEPPF